MRPHLLPTLNQGKKKPYILPTEQAAYYLDQKKLNQFNPHIVLVIVKGINFQILLETSFHTEFSSDQRNRTFYPENIKTNFYMGLL